MICSEQMHIIAQAMKWFLVTFELNLIVHRLVHHWGVTRRPAASLYCSWWWSVSGVQQPRPASPKRTQPAPSVHTHTPQPYVLLLWSIFERPIKRPDTSLASCKCHCSMKFMFSPWGEQNFKSFCTMLLSLVGRGEVSGCRRGNERRRSQLWWVLVKWELEGPKVEMYCVYAHFCCAHLPVALQQLIALFCSSISTFSSFLILIAFVEWI